MWPQCGARVARTVFAVRQTPARPSQGSFSTPVEWAILLRCKARILASAVLTLRGLGDYIAQIWSAVRFTARWRAFEAPH